MASGSSKGGGPWMLNPEASGLGAHRRPDGCQAAGGAARSLSLECRAEAQWPLQDSSGCCAGPMMCSRSCSFPE